MSAWKAVKARQVVGALLRRGWIESRRRGSHRTLSKEGWPDFTFAFHDNEEIGPTMMAKIARRTGLSPEDL